MSVAGRLYRDINEFVNARKVNTLKIFYFILFCGTCFFGIEDYLKGNIAISILLACMSILSLLNLVLLSKRKIHYKLSTLMLVYPFCGLMLYLVYTGGINNTGHLWIFFVPIVIFSLYEIRKAVLMTLLFVLALIVILYFPEIFGVHYMHYTHDFKIRLLIVFVLESLLIFSYIYHHDKLFETMKSYTEEFSAMSEQDQLTGLYNRRGIRFQLDQLCAEYEKYDKNFSVILCDIDYFKDINDRYGHQIGDQVLAQVAQIIRDTIRKSDFAARWGGEEFLIVLPGASQRQAYIVAEKIRQRILQFLLRHQGDKIKVSISSGVAQMADAASIDDLIRKADDYMYQAKAKGRNITIPFYLTTPIYHI